MNKIKILAGVVLLIVCSFTFQPNYGWCAFPEKQIRFIVAYPPGGVSDITARPLVQAVNRHLNNKVYIDNIVGAAGSIGWREAGKSPADGYTVVFVSTALTVGPNMRKDFPKILELFDPLCIINLESRVIATASNKPFKTLQDLLSAAKAKPRMVTVGHSGVGSTQHLAMVALAHTAGIDFNLVPHKGGGPSIVAALGGHIDAVCAEAPGVAEYVKAGKMRVLAAFGKERYDIFPDAPTVKEIGYDVVIEAFSGIAAPKGTPKQILDVLEKAFSAASKEPDYLKAMSNIGLVPIFLPSDQSTAFIKKDLEYYKGVATKAGLKPE